MKKILTACFLLLSCATIAQSPNKVVADRIIAVVGSKIILHSDISNTLMDMERQGIAIPANATCLLMEQAVSSKLLMIQAEKDSLLTDAEIEAQLDEKLGVYFAKLETSDIEIKAIDQIKNDARESVKEQLLSEAMRNKISANVRITPGEVKAFFDRIPKDSLPMFDAQLEICEIVVYPKASPDLEQYIIGEMNNYKKQLELKMTTFERLAKEVSEDPGPGQYELHRNEKTLDPVFLSTAFRLKEGEISEPVKSRFGYHIIQLIKRDGDIALVRHILRVPLPTAAEIDQAKRHLDYVRSLVIAGEMNFNAAAAKYSESETSKYTGPCITDRDGSTRVMMDILDKDMGAIVSKMNVGDISTPASYTDELKKDGVRIIFLKSRLASHRMNMQDDYTKLTQLALEEKKQKVVEKWLMTALVANPVDLDPQTEMDCPGLKKFMK